MTYWKLPGFALLAPAGHDVEERHERSASTNFASRLREIPRPFWHFLAGVFAHGMGDFAPTLLILRASQILAPRLGLGRAATVSVALYTFYNIVNAAVAYPAGALGDRIGKRRLLAVGYVIAGIFCAGFILERPTIPVLVVLFGLAGVHGAFQQSLEKSLAAELLPRAIRGAGFGVLATVNGIGDLVSSVAVGALWSGVSPAAGFLYAGIFSVVGAVLIARWR